MGPTYGRCFRDGSEDYVACKNPPKWRVKRQGPGIPRVACHRHIGWLLGYMTVPGRTVEVTHLPAND